ncbi:MAG: CDP-alcohol phosphatidyltransferase family protein [Pseudomonadota bacterium]|nr:CDP-alcohol phosphatidyltransferase family protein [Pseudomonadota bacterium]
MASAHADMPQKMQDGWPRGRPLELEDPLNRFIYHPLAARLARLLVPTGVTPNAVSVAGALMVWAAAWAYTMVAWPLGALLGLAFHMLWHVVDGADGDLARLTGKSSPLGEMVDGACDYAGHAILYIALAAMLDDQLGIWSWLLGLAAAASHSLQTNHSETQRRSYLWWAYGVPWLKHAKAAEHEVFEGRNWFTTTFGWLARRYLAVANRMTPASAAIDQAIEAAAGDPRRTRLIRGLVRRASRRSLSLEKVVGANPRTIILGLSMALGTPLYFFLAETVLLNLLLIVSVRHHNKVGRRLADKFAQLQPGQLRARD